MSPRTLCGIVFALLRMNGTVPGSGTRATR